MKKSLVTAGVLLAIQQPLFAAGLPPIVITPTRTAETASESLAAVTTLDRKDIERLQAVSVPDLIRALPGVTLSNNGGMGKVTSVFLRGTESDQVLVLIDGIKAGSATSGTVAFENLPVDQIERIEIVRGPRSSLYGSEAVGGVIQIFTRKGGGDTRPYVSLGGGSDSTFSGSAGISGGGARGRFHAGLSGLDTKGFNACNGEPLVGGCFTSEPDRDGYRNVAGSFNGGWHFDNGIEAGVTFLRSDGKSEFDGDFVNETETAQQVLGGSLRFAPLADWSSMVHVGQSRDDSDNFKDGAFMSRFDTTRDSLSFQNDITVAAGQLLTLGLDWLNDKVDSDQAFTVTGRDNLGLFGQFQWAPGRHELQASLRYDDNEQFGGETTGGLAWGYDLGNSLRVTASWGTAFKAPSFNDLYFPGFGNPNLEPEESDSLELGLRGTASFGSWAIHAFQTDVDQLIAFDPVTFSPANIDSARIRGLEAELSTTIAGWTTRAALTLLDPENRSAGPQHGNELPRRAGEALRVDTDRDFDAYRLGASLIAQSSRYDDIANTMKLDSYAIVNLRGEYLIAPDWRVQLRVENLFDTDYETAAFYNQPGLGAFVTLRYQPGNR